jgi:pimeloyl-ACP methyl ester carboxylesterase
VADEVLLLLPGMALNASVFPQFGLPAVGVDFTRLVVEPDGWSAELEAKRMGFYVERLVARLRTERQWAAARRRVVVAHSFGGFLALAWQLASGNDPLARIDGLVLVSTSAGPIYGTVRLRLAGGKGWGLRVPVGPLMRLWNSTTITRLMDRLSGPGGGAGEVDFQRLRSRSDLAVGLAGWRNTDWRARRSYRFAMRGFDVRNRLSGLSVPAIVLHGARDVYFPLEAARELARLLPRAQLRVVPAAAHTLPLTHGPEVVRAVRDLLRTGEGGTEKGDG